MPPSFGGDKGSTPDRMKLPARCVLSDVPYVHQIRNYCGPAALTSVLNFWGFATDQKAVGKAVFDNALQATNGADMMLYARQKGFSAYSWNSDLDDLKEKLALGVPVIILQDSSTSDRSGHYRVATGYDDSAHAIYVDDPYEPESKSMPYDKFAALWDRHGNWALLICPTDRDTFKRELDERNPVVHIDLAYIYFKRGDAEASERESRLALALEPGNYSARDLHSKSTQALGARGKSEKSRDN